MHLKTIVVTTLFATIAATASLAHLQANNDARLSDLPNPSAYQQDSESQEKSPLHQSIEKVLSVQTNAWNDGDLEKFMSTYWKSEKLSFSSGGQTTYGWDATLERYRRGYAPPKEMGKLHFDHLEVSAIESNSALVLGHWHLKMKDGTKKDGNFSLVLKNIQNEWKIIHDHSSIKKDEK